MRLTRTILLVLVLVFAGTLMAEAADFGFVKVKGKNLKALREEVASIQKLIKDWKDGEVLYTRETSTGAVFKNHQILVIFAGETSQVTGFLSKAPYEGDVLQKVVGKFLFNSRREGQVKGLTAFAFRREFSSVRDVLKLLQNASARSLYHQLKSAGNGGLPLPKMMGAGQVFHTSVRPENFLFTVEGTNFVDDSKLIAPPGYTTMKDYTAEEAKDYINNLDL